MTWTELQKRVIHCERCPRLRLYCQGIVRKRKPEFKQFSYWGKPVPGFGDPKAKLWIIGLAPGAHGANRTGRMFTGDSSGNWLYEVLYRYGLSNQPNSQTRHDGLKLNTTYISAAARCAPPDNKPSKEELSHCCQYLDEEFKLLTHKKIILALGKIAFDATLKLLKRQNISLPKTTPVFFHGANYQLGELNLTTSYHPSRQNTNTGLLTQAMWDTVFKNISQRINEA